MGLKSYDNFLRSGNIIEPSYDNFLKQTAIIIRRDPYFNLTSLLLHGDGTNATQNNTFLDSSTNNFTITRNGNPTQGTISPYGNNWSNYFDGNGDTLSTTAVNISSGDFTIESWVYLNAMPTSDSWPGSYSNWMEIIGVGSASVGDGWQFRIGQTVLAFGTNGDTTAVSATHGMSANTWYHLACVRSGNTYTLYVNGSSIGSATYTANAPGTGAFTWIGSETNQGAYLNGYISNVRIVTSALYSSNFTPPTAPLTAVTNTILLTCQSNRYKDNSTNNFTITRNGDVSVQKFSPFSPTAAYSSSTFGGSGYFDGSGDYLTAPSNNAFAVGTGDFTFETWIYPRYSFGGSTYQTIAGNRSGAINSTTEWTLGVTNAGSVYVYTNTFNIQTSNGVFTNDQWYHVALVRSSGTATLYINGSSAGTANMSGYNFTDTTFAIGANDDGSETLSAILSSCRLLKGTALYTTNFTPPTSPLTNITNTSLLLNGTNAGIFDNAMINNLETIGNAQISTTQSKFGGSSMYFDGNGDFLQSRYGDAFNFGTANFTIEMWINPSTTNHQSACLISQEHIGASNTPISIAIFLNGGSFESVGNQIAFGIYNGSAGSSWIVNSQNLATISVGVWTHIALVRNGNVFTLYVNGTSVGTATNSTSCSLGTTQYFIGRRWDLYGSYPYYNGYIDDLRITKGLARYTTNFTLPTEVFPDF